MKTIPEVPEDGYFPEQNLAVSSQLELQESPELEWNNQRTKFCGIPFDFKFVKVPSTKDFQTVAVTDYFYEILVNESLCGRKVPIVLESDVYLNWNPNSFLSTKVDKKLLEGICEETSSKLSSVLRAPKVFRLVLVLLVLVSLVICAIGFVLELVMDNFPLVSLLGLVLPLSMYVSYISLIKKYMKKLEDSVGQLLAEKKNQLTELGLSYSIGPSCSYINFFLIDYTPN